eukprot:gene1625-4761_t
MHTFCKANDILISRGYKQETTLFASSCCSDEINRLIDHQMEFWGEHFQLGGLAGYPFVGRTGFSAYQSHMPEHNGKLFILCAAHVGISKAGNLGYCDRPGMDHESKACGSALAAYFQLLSESVHHEMSCSEALAAHDLQQFLITKLVYSRLEEIKQSGIVKELFCDLMQLSCLFQLLLSIYHAVAPFTENPIATLSLVLAEENFKELCAIIPPDFDRSEVAILSGLEVNTHHDADDFFIPLNFTIRHKDGSYENVLPNLLDILQK